MAAVAIDSSVAVKMSSEVVAVDLLAVKLKYRYEVMHIVRYTSKIIAGVLREGGSAQLLIEII